MEMADVAAMIDESEAMTVLTPSAEGNALEAAE
jgi:hypothetical protein